MFCYVCSSGGASYESAIQAQRQYNSKAAAPKSKGKNKNNKKKKAGEQV